MTQDERRLFLLNYLIEESEEYSRIQVLASEESEKYRKIQVPASKEEQKKLLRSLFNVRPAKEAADEFLKIQNEYLQYEIKSKGITNANTLPPVRDKISLWQGDITTLRCGAIVNAANSCLLGCFIPCHGCIDNAIHTYAGIQLRLECDYIMQRQKHKEPAGQAKLTKAYNLPCDYVIHTVGPIVYGSLTDNDKTLLKSCYKECLKEAEKNKIKSIAFCCISTGEFHFPKEKAAEIAVKTVTEYLKNSKIERVIFNVFKDDDKRIYENLLG